MSGWDDSIFSNLPRVKLGVPASVTVGGVATALYPTAGLPSPLPPQQGTTLNSPPPDWLRQMQDQRFAGY